MDSTIASLQQRCSEIVEDSYEYLDRKLKLDQREKKILYKVLNASLQRLLREPIQELKQIETREEQKVSRICEKAVPDLVSIKREMFLFNIKYQEFPYFSKWWDELHILRQCWMGIFSLT